MPPSIPILIGNGKIDTTLSACNHGVIFADALTQKLHITAVCKSNFSHIHRTSQVHGHFSLTLTNIIIHITSQLDYCNCVTASSQFVTLPRYSLSRIQLPDSSPGPTNLIMLLLSLKCFTGSLSVGVSYWKFLYYLTEPFTDFGPTYITSLLTMY